jgi:hypothetical protein
VGLTWGGRFGGGHGVHGESTLPATTSARPNR